MAYYVTNLITDSFYLSSILSEEFEEISGYQLNKGLSLLNSFLSFKAADNRLIPYFKLLEFDAIIGEEKYFIQDLAYIETLTFNLDTVRFPMQPVQRVQYFGTARANNVETLPSVYFSEPTLNGCDLYMYPLPQSDYTFSLRGKFRLINVTLGQDLEIYFDKYYIEYLRYGLADYICQDYQIEFPISNQRKLDKYESILFDESPIDFSMQKQSILQTGSGVADIYAQANILKGWMPP